MGVIIKQSLINSIALSTGILIGILNRIFFFPHALSESEIGLVQLITSISIILAQLGLYGFSSTITKYYADFKSQNKLSPFLGFAFIFSTLLFLIIFSIFYIFQTPIISRIHPEMEQLSLYTTLIFIISFSGMYIHLFNNISYNNLKTSFPSILNNVIPKGITLILLWCIAIDVIDFNEFLNLYSLPNLIILLLLIIYVLKVLKEKIQFNLKSNFSNPNLKTLKYGSYVYFGSLTTLISQTVDSLMLSSINGLAQTGIYTIAFFMGTVIEMPRRALVSITMPIISLNWTNGAIDKIKKIYSQTSINQGIIGILFFLLLLVSINEIFSLIPNSEKYVVGKNVALIIGFSKVIDMIFGANTEILRTSNKYKWDFILMSFFIILSILSNHFLIPIHGINGAAIATFVSILSYNLSRFLVIKYFFKIQPFTKETLILSSILIVLGGLGFYINETLSIHTSMIYNIVMIIIKTILLVSIYSFLVYKLKVSNEYNLIIDKGISTIKNQVLKQ